MALENDYSYVKLFRKMFDWEWYTNVCTCKLFIHMLLKANHSDQKWQGELIKKGTFVTSLGNLASETGLTVQQVRTAIKNLKKTGDIEVKSTNKNTLISIGNYGFYQGMQVVSNKQITNKQQTNNKQITTNNNDNNVNNDNKLNNSRFIPPTLEEVTAYCNERNNSIEPSKFIDFYQTKDWMVGRNKMKDWKACVRTWESREKKSKIPSQKQTQGRNLPQWYTDQKNGVEEEFRKATPEEIEEINKLLEELG